MNKGGLVERGVRKSFDSSLPRLTVITVVKNDCAFIENTIKSVLGQSYHNIEYIVIDGGSSDGTLDIIRRYDDKIDLWISEPDAGVYDAMNKGIDLATSEWLNFMNSGDIFVSGQIVEEVFLSKKSDWVSFIYSDAYMRDYSQDKNVTEFWWTNFEIKSILHQCVFYKKELHQSLGRYISQKGLIAADYFFFNMIPKDAVMKYEEKPIAIYRTDSGISTSPQCRRQVLCIDFLFGRIDFNRLVFELIQDWFVPAKKRNQVKSVIIKSMNKIRSLLNKE